MKIENTQPQLEEATRQLVCELVGLGLPQRSVARYVGISPSALAKAMRQDPAFGEAVRTAEDRLVERCLAVIRKAARTSRAAATWLRRHGFSLEPTRDESDSKNFGVT